MRPERNGVRARRVTKYMVVMLVFCVGVIGIASVASAAAPRSATAWDWAESARFWNGATPPALIEPTLCPDPLGIRKGSVLLVDFAAFGYNFYCTDHDAGKFHLENGRDYTFVFDVYAPDLNGAEADRMCGMDVRFAPDVGQSCCDCCMENVEFAADGLWHKIYVHVDGFRGVDGDYILRCFDQYGNGTWYLADITQHGGVGKSLYK